MNYCSLDIISHLEKNWGSNSYVLTEGYGPKEKLNLDFKVVEFPPGEKHGFWIYSTAGMSIGKNAGNAIELQIFSIIEDRKLIRVLASASSYHRNENS